MQVTRKQTITAIIVLSISIVVAVIISQNGPKAKFKAQRPAPVLNVDAEPLRAQSYQFELSSFGTVQPRTQTLLVSQVSGVITQVNPVFRDGGFFSKDEVLIQIDDRDYQATAKVAKAELLQSQLSLEEEKARAQQAQIDWSRLGDGKAAPDLVLRKPQLAAAEAKRFSAQANYDKALLDLERTRIRAPFDGRVKSKQVDLGQYINSNATLAEIFATDVVEIRLPLKNSELAWIDLPENYRNQSVDEAKLPKVTIISDLGSHQEWQGKIVRTEAAIDESSHQLYVIAQLQDPFAVQQTHKTPLKIGQYVTARIEGRLVKNALVIPTSSIYQGSYVYVVNDNTLQRRNVSLAFQTPTDAVVTDGLSVNEWLITSPMGQVSSGTRVAVNSENIQTEPKTTANPQTAGVKP